MGVKGLKQYVEDNKEALTRKMVFRSPCGSAKRKVLVVDGLSCLRVFYNPRLDWLCGGQWTELRDELYGFVRRFRQAGFDLVFIFDGVVERGKRQVWLQRRKQDVRNTRHVFDHVERTGCYPARNKFCLPAALSTYVRMALKSVGVEVINSLGEADREIAQYCLSNHCYGVLGEDSDYLIFPIPHYFTTKDIHVGERRIDMISYDRQKLCEHIKLCPNRLPVLAGLCGNDLLDASRLAGFHRRLTGVAGSEKPIYREVVARVAEFISSFPHSVSGEQIAAQAFGSSYDHRLSMFRDLLAMYDLSKCGDTYLTSRETVVSEIAVPDAVALGATNVDDSVVIASESSDKPWVEVDIDGLSEDDDNDGSTGGDTADCSVQSDTLCRSVVKDQIKDDRQCISSHDHTALLQGESPTRAVHRSSNQPHISPAVMEEARRRHLTATIVHLVYQVMCVAEIDMGCTLEDPDNRYNLPPAAILFQPIRERLYGIILGVRESKLAESKKPVSRSDIDTCLSVGKNAVKEWCVYRGNTLTEADIVPARAVPQCYVSLEDLWFGHGDEKLGVDRQMAAFCYCLGWPQMPYKTIRLSRILLCAILHFMINQPNELLLEEWELNAFLIQGTDPALSRVDQLHRVRIRKPDCRAIELAATLMRGLYVAVFAYNACGLVHDDRVTSPWLCFNGKLFHQKYLEAKQGKSIEMLCANKQNHISEVHQLKAIVTSGTTNSSSSAMQSASHTAASSCRVKANQTTEQVPPPHDIDSQPQHAFAGELSSNKKTDILQAPTSHYTNERQDYRQETFTWEAPMSPSSVPFVPTGLPVVMPYSIMPPPWTSQPFPVLPFGFLPPSPLQWQAPRFVPYQSYFQPVAGPQPEEWQYYQQPRAESPTHSYAEFYHPGNSQY